MKFSSLEELLDSGVPKNETITKSLIKTWHIINNSKYNKILCSISGGADSDIILDICYKCDKDNKIKYVYFDTGLEYQATKDHILYLKDKYNIEIKTYKAIIPVPTVCKEYGEPFLSKHVSKNIASLQKYGFKWEDEPLEVLLKRYCKWSEKTNDYRGCKSALMWWCNANPNGRENKFNISNNKWLKEYIMQFPPSFKISDECCTYTKKKNAANIIEEGRYDLSITGVRKAEGGIRSAVYSGCYDESDDSKSDRYRPIFWYLNKDKEDYVKYYQIIHSKCYTKYRFRRTGCACCPFGKNFLSELATIRRAEPNLYKAVNNIFKNSYEYTKNYRLFQDEEDLKCQKT